MKAYILSFLFLFSSALIIGQTCITDPNPNQDTSACCNDLISTDYNYPHNTEYPALENTTIAEGGPNDHPNFNWLEATGVLPNPHTLNINYDNTLFGAEHPFLVQSDDYGWFSNYENGQPFPLEGHNMHPRYGWELMHMDRGLGLYGNSTVQANSGQLNPYIIFYNKYNGKLRLVVSPAEGNSFDNANTDLTILNDNTGELVSSALLNRYNTLQTALDQQTEIQTVSSDLPFTTPTKWSISDFQLAYDPCVCNNQSRIKFSFKERNFASVLLSGRIVGSEVPLNTSGNSPLRFGDDFLSSVWVGQDENNFDIANTGMLVYNQIAEDVESAYVSDGMKLLGQLFNTIKSPLKNVKAGFTIAPGSPVSIKVKSGPFLSAAAGFISKQLNPPAPKITYLEAEAAFSGVIDDMTNAGGFANIELLHPGSYDANRLAIPWTQHPFYNEIPGLFALLRTPDMQFAHDWGGVNSPSLGGFGVAIDDPLEYVLNPAAEIDMGATEIYAAIEFDVYAPTTEHYHTDNPGIYGSTYDGDPNYPIVSIMAGLDEDAAFNNIEDSVSYDAASSIIKILEPSFKLAEIEFVDGGDLIEQFPVLEDFSNNSNNFTYTSAGLKTKMTFQTAFVPIDKLDDLRFTEKFKKLVMNHSHWENSFPGLLELFNFRLKIIGDYTFLPNEYGDVNQTIQVYTYRFGNKTEVEFSFMDTCAIAPNPICDTDNYNQFDFQTNLVLDTTHFTTSQDIYADVITIIGALTADQGVEVNLYATNEIISEGGSVSPDINLIIFDPYPHEGLDVVSEVNLKVFCKNNYKASTATTPFREEPPIFRTTNHEEEGPPALAFECEVFPNPTNNDLNLRVNLTDDAEVRVRLADLSGKTLKTFVDHDVWRKGEQTRLFQMSEIQTSGLYYLEVCIDGYCTTKKINFIKK